jgi:N6-L-threonylcarbamoyladenine synthase
MLCLGIESTAHTFGASVAEKDDGDEFKLLSDVKDVYRAPEGSGIHPREASRHHLTVSPHVLNSALEEARTRIDEIDFVAYSAGPGLGPCLRVGGVVARAIAAHYAKKLVAANHAIGHIELGKHLTGLKDPLVLLVSGGHTALAAVLGDRWRIFGETLDLTLGQILDQLGRFMGLSSPAGPKMEELASQDSGEGKRLLGELPYVIKGNDVSYSGLLSAAKELYAMGEKKEAICFATQEMAFTILAEATERALAFTGKNELLITGGVAANKRLSAMFQEMSDARRVKLGVIERRYSGDCGAQIAAEGFRLFERGHFVEPTSAFVRQSWRIDQVSVN